MNPLQKNITEITEQVAEKLGFLLIEVSLKGDNRSRIIEIFIDSSKGVTIDDCAQLSREVTTVIESTDLITTKYRLDVSSPGIDRPLKFPEQFHQHINRKFEIILKDNPEADSDKNVSVENVSDENVSERQPIEKQYAEGQLHEDESAVKPNLKAAKTAADKKRSKSAKLIGRLLRVDGEVLTFSINNSETNINFNNIKTAKVQISF
ncbi:MAG: ribosome maturation factor RimP [Bacillota bacterium]